MKAVVIEQFVSNFEDLKPRDAPLPSSKKSSDIQIKVTHASLTHVDMLYAQGLHQNNKRHVKPPFVLGTEFAGIVISSPSNKFAPGDRVFGGGLGSYAESICVDEGIVRRVPGLWSNAEACAVGVSGAVSYGSLISVARLKRGETVLVLGASGGLGVMAIQIAKAVGAKVIALVGDKEKSRIMKELGADEAVSYRQRNWEEEVRALTDDGEGVHVVYDAIGAIESALKCLRYRGRIVIVGFAARGGKMEEVRANRILLKSAMVHGYRYGEDGRRDPRRTEEVWSGFLNLVEAGGIRPIIFQGNYMGLESIPRAFGDLKMHKVWGRAVLRINEDVEATKEAARL